MDWQHFPWPSVPASDFEVNTVYFETLPSSNVEL